MDSEDGGSTEAGGKTALFQMILMGLCNNFNVWESSLSGGDCEFKPQIKYDMMAYRGAKLKITTIEQMPMSGTEISNVTGKLVGTGVAFNMFHEIQENIGFEYEIILPDYNEIGDNTRGAIKLLAEKKVNMAVMFIPTLKEYRQWISFSDSLGEAEFVLMMKRPSASATGSGLLAPFEGNVWYAIFVSLLAIGPIIYGLIVLRAKLCKGDEDNHIYALPSCVWFVYGALMKQGSTLSPVADSARILFATWWLFITILTSFYTANLTAFLTLSQFTLTITTQNDIVKYNRKWVADNGGETYEMITKADEMKALNATSAVYGTFLTNPTPEDTFKEAKLDKIYVSEKRRAKILIQQNYLNKTTLKVEEAERCTYVLTKPFLTKPMAMAYPKGEKLARVMNPMLSYFVQGGIVDHLLNMPLPMTEICPLNLPSSERKLRNSDLKTTYYVVGVGFALATASFIFEVVYRWQKRRNIGLSVNSGDVQRDGKFKQNIQYGDNLKNNFGFMNENKPPSTFLFQYTN